MSKRGRFRRWSRHALQSTQGNRWRCKVCGFVVYNDEREPAVADRLVLQHIADKHKQFYAELMSRAAQKVSAQTESAMGGGV
jgi:hypothetical protein